MGLAVLTAHQLAPQKYIFERVIQYFAGQHRLLFKFKTPATLNWFSM